jgi:hypothetical protein
LYAISGILGLASVSLAAENSAGKLLAIVGVAVLLLVLYFRILKSPGCRRMSGLYEEADPIEEGTAPACKETCAPETEHAPSEDEA